MLPTLPPALLTLPPPGDGQLAAVRRKVGLLALRQLLGFGAAGLPRAFAATLARAQAGLARELRRAPEPLLAAVLDVDVLTPLLVLQSGLGEPAALLGEALPQLLARLRPAEDLLWDQPVRVLTRPGQGLWRLDPPAAGLRAGPDGVELRTPAGRFERLEAPPEQPFLPLGAPGLALSLLDSNPLAMVEDHPEKSGNTLSLGARPAAEWVAALDEALALVRVGLPTWAAELPLALQRVVPVGYEPERHLSASYREAPFVAYLTLHPDPLTLAEALVHETQHGKLNLLSWLDPILHNGRTTWTSSPVRPDLRPLMGVLLAVHAFVPVAALHAGLRAAGHPVALAGRFARRRAEVLASNQRGLDVLRPLAQPTAVGARLLAELSALHQALAEQGGDHALPLDPTPLEGPSMG